mmetsp:Transcript_21051/g.54010  ORF Transcript_21051/g.54010 Transcript_21051/m.54010 type:complete len:300 (-) Transcript_21051:50-949(-)
MRPTSSMSLASSAAVHCCVLSPGRSWLHQRSRHCFAQRPSTSAAMACHEIFSRALPRCCLPIACTSCSSSATVHLPAFGGTAARACSAERSFMAAARDLGAGTSFFTRVAGFGPRCVVRAVRNPARDLGAARAAIGSGVGRARGGGSPCSDALLASEGESASRCTTPAIVGAASVASSAAAAIIISTPSTRASVVTAAGAAAAAAAACAWSPFRGTGGGSKLTGLAATGMAVGLKLKRNGRWRGRFSSSHSVSRTQRETLSGARGGRGLSPTPCERASRSTMGVEANRSPRLTRGVMSS